MFWKDIDQIKQCVNRLTDRLERIDNNVENILGYVQESSEEKSTKLEILEKYNCMINELKGCVSLARGAVLDRKQVDSEQSARVHQLVYHVETILDDNCQIISVMRKNIEQFAHFMQNCEKKSDKKRKFTKNKEATSRCPESE
jgi:hypothetical protein